MTVGRGRDAGTELLHEYEINLDVARDVARRLRARFAASADVEVLLTWGENDGLWRPWRWDSGPASDDEPAVRARGALCSLYGADLVVSLHTNATSVPANGTLTGYRDDDDLALASAVHARMLEDLRVVDGRRIGAFRDFGLDPGEWWISEGAPTIPAALLEPAMMSDPEEAARLQPSIAEGGARRMQIAAIEALVIGDFVAASR